MKRFDARRIVMRVVSECCVVLTAWFAASAVTARAASPAQVVSCDLQQASCIQKIGGAISIEFDAQPRPITAMSESNFMVTLSRGGKPVTDAAVRLDLSMPGMFMGWNRLVLKQVTTGRYEGKGIITLCASGKKTWQADVTIDSAGTTTVAGFIFEVK
jgi:hypothetical protein